jgi:hypothetical protein
MLYDTTVFGGANEGIFCTGKTIFAHESFENPVFIHFNQIISIEASDNTIFVNGRALIKTLAGDIRHANAIVDFLIDIKNFVG